MGLSPLFRTSSYEWGSKRTEDSFFDFRPKEFTPFEHLTYQNQPCGRIKEKDQIELALRVLVVATTAIGVHVFLKSAKAYCLKHKIISVSGANQGFRVLLFAHRGIICGVILRSLSFFWSTESHRYITTESPELISEALEVLQKDIDVNAELTQALISSEKGEVVPNKISEDVFTLESHPELIFKKYRHLDDVYPDEHFFNRVVAQALCLKHGWTHLVLPPVRKVQVGDTLYIVEKKLDIHEGDTTQEYYYLNYEDRLAKAAKELQAFILLTGLSNVSWHHNSVIGDPESHTEDLSISLHDIALTQDSSGKGIYGEPSKPCTVLMKMLGPKLSKQLLDDIKKHHPNLADQTQAAYDKRESQLKWYDQMKYFYNKHGITSVNDPIPGKVALNVDRYVEIFQEDPKKGEAFLMGCKRANELLQMFNQDYAKNEQVEAPQVLAWKRRLTYIVLIEDQGPQCSEIYRDALKFLKAQGKIHSYTIKTNDKEIEFCIYA